MAKSEIENVMGVLQDASAVTTSALLRKEFNRNRKIVLKNVAGITVEVISHQIYLFIYFRLMLFADGPVNDCDLAIHRTGTRT